VGNDREKPGKRRDIWLACGGLIVGLVYLAPSLVGLKAFLAADIWMEHYPWNLSIPAGWEAFRTNAVLFDIPNEMAPLFWVARECLALGDWPLWNPCFRCGAPLLANGQSAIFAPTNLPHWVAPWPLGFAWAALLRLGIVWAGAWLFARRLKLGRSWATAVALGITFCPGLMSWFQHPHANSCIFLPWLLWGVERLCQARSRREAATATAVLGGIQGLQLLGGHPESAFNVSVGAAAYLLIRAPWGPWPKAAALRIAGLGALAFGAVLAAPALLPMAEFILNSSTLAERTPGAESVGLGAWRLPGRAAWLFWNPLAFGSPIEGAKQAWFESGNWTERQQYIGIVPWVIVALGALSGKAFRREIRLPMAGLLAMVWVGGSMAFGLPPLREALVRVPPFSFNANPRMALLAQAAVVAAAGLIGSQWIRSERSGKSRAGPYWAAVAVAGIGGVAAVGLGLAEQWTARPWVLVCAALAALAACRLAQGNKGAWAAAALLPALWACDVAPVWKGFHVQVPREWADPRRASTPLIEAVASSANPRILSQAAMPNTLAFFGISDVRAYDFPVSARNAAYMRKIAGTGDLEFTAEHLSDPRSLIALSRCAAPWLFTSNPPPRHPAARNVLRPVGQEAGAILYRNGLAPPLAEWRADGQVDLEPDMESALARLEESLLEAPERVVVEDWDLAASGSPPGRPLEAEIRFVTPRRIVALLPGEALRDDGYLIVRQSYDKGWRAMSGKQRLDVLPAQVRFMAVRVPAGISRVELAYSPRSFWVGLVLGIVGWMALVSFAVVTARRGV
jgi:hypothetical protein